MTNWDIKEINMKFRIVLLTNGHELGWQILQGLKARNISPDFIIFTQGRIIWNDFSLIHKKTRFLVLCLITPYRIIKKKLRQMNFIKNRLDEQIIYSGRLNSPQLQKDLEFAQPDFIILGGMGILSAQIIKTARYGVINVHPGLLPWARNCGVVGRSLEMGIPIGVTAHYVDEGVDTGRIIERRLLAIQSKNLSLNDLEKNAQLLSSEIMVHIVDDFLMKGIVPKGECQEDKYPPCTRMSSREQEALNEKIKNGLAHDLFLKWQPYCEGTDKTILYCKREKELSIDKNDENR